MSTVPAEVNKKSKHLSEANTNKNLSTAMGTSTERGMKTTVAYRWKLRRLRDVVLHVSVYGSVTRGIVYSLRLMQI